MRKVVGSSPGRTSSQNIKITEDKELPLLLYLHVVKLSVLLRDGERKPILSGSQLSGDDRYGSENVHKNIHLRDGDYLEMIASCSHSILLTKHASK